MEGAVRPKGFGGLLFDVADKLASARVLAAAGVLRPVGPGTIRAAARVLRKWGVSPAAGYAVSAALYPDQVAVVDDAGTLTFAEVEARSNALARGLAGQGVTPEKGFGILVRNHRYFIETTLALWKLGATGVYLNTAFAGPQLADVAEREKLQVLVYDQEFGELIKAAARGRSRFLAWQESEKDTRTPTLEGLIAAGDRSQLEPPARPGRTIILTSGTSGTPKGAARHTPSALSPAISLLSRIPLKRRQLTFIAAPLFHSWGFSHFTLGELLSSTYLLQRRFDPEATLAAIEEHRPTALIAVPVMIQRILELPETTRRRYDLSSLRVVALSGSSLPGELAERFMDEYGDIVYNLYGSTEVAWATIATPADLRAAPGTAGRPPLRTVVGIYDEKGVELPRGKTGRIFVGNEFRFEGYTDGGGKQSIDGLLSTGDVGYVDEGGRLFVAGRDDEMIVSGGENVYPREVEDLLARHAAVADVAVIGVPDEQFGQALKAFIVRRRGATLDEAAVQEHVRSNLARYKVPRQVEFVDALPRNATGKVLKRELSA